MDKLGLVLVGILVLGSFYFLNQKPIEKSYNIEIVDTGSNRSYTIEEVTRIGKEQIIKLGAPNTTSEDIVDLCGNRVCEPESGETPWNCFRDCKHKVWDLDSIFCMPLFNCGNWQESWFMNLLIIILIIVVINYQFRVRKTKRKI